MADANMEGKQLMERVAKILDDSRMSIATHNRKLKELLAIRSKSPSMAQFSSAFYKTLTPVFRVHRRTPSTDRVVRFVSTFACVTDHEFLEGFLRFLLVGFVAADRTVRFRACQIVSEIIMRLPDDTEVSNEVWNEVIECMKVRVEDKVSLIRTFAVRSLSRFVNDSDNSDILHLFLELLSLEQNVEVRKIIVLSLPPSNATSQAIIDCTLDVSESVRKAAYCVLANKFPLQSLSIKHRAIILQRGLADRSETVSKECLKLMKDQWLVNHCCGNVVELLKYFDVETYELVGESVMEALLKDGSVKLSDSESIREYISSASDENEDSLHFTRSIQLMEAEVALYWRTVCRHLQMEAQAKGSEAAATLGTEATVYAAEASDKNDHLERILPATVSDYVELVKTHIDAGPNYRFASRQLLLLGEMLDFSDTSIRKVASEFVQDLLHRPLEYEVDDEGNKVVIGDGINLGGDNHWADAVSRLASKVHAATGEFEEVILEVVKELARPCRERTADSMQWMHGLSVAGLLLGNAKSFHLIQGKAIESSEFLQSLLIPGAKHVHLDVQRVAVRCLGLFGLLENKPSKELVKQLRLSFLKGPSTISIMACKALIDLGMWHGPQEVDKATEKDFSLQPSEDKMTFTPIKLSETDEDLNIALLRLLYSGIQTSYWGKCLESDENESIQAVLGEGFAKVLLLSENYPSIPASLHPLLLAKLINLYFSDESKDLQRLKQCLSIFFWHYASLSANHKKCMSTAFVQAMRSMWPGINGNAGGSAFVVSNKRKRAVQASKYMLQMMQAPLYAKDTQKQNESGGSELPETSEHPSLECGEEGLLIRIAAEVLRFHTKKTPAEKTYVSALCRILVLLNFQSSEQGAIKLMQRLLNCVSESVSTEKDLVKELKRMAERLKAVDRHPDEELSQDEAKLIFGRLGLDLNLDVDAPVAVPHTPVPCSTRPSRSRRRVKPEETSSDEERSHTSVQSVPPSASIRSQRASKTAAMSKITTKAIPTKIDEDDEGEEESSEVTSEDDSDESDQFTAQLSYKLQKASP
ncbi:hypothetical protein Ddye_012403 [Dipteronia dyeriana]|uniref:Nuclear condensin complex subunit 3 C-terminal domain-containing protein n=1 Tax=Dipteronia dyeriana TaxID=168575 RepID=A0AAD9X4B7_9ROSI|nr:hypothetical protein Ddye_012403 [Dipteronia dyeriana]